MPDFSYSPLPMLSYNVFVCVCISGKLNTNDEELEAMLNEGKGPINFTVFLSLFGEKLNGKTC